MDVPFVSKYYIEVLVCKLARTAECTSSGALAFKQISTGLQVIQTVWHISFKKRCIDKEPCIFPLVDHLVQELNDRLLTRESFLRTISFSSKAEYF